MTLVTLSYTVIKHYIERQKMKLINQFDPALIAKRYVSSSYSEFLHFEEVSAIVYFNANLNTKSKIFAIGYSGRRTKHDFHYSFNSIESMNKHIDEWRKRLKRWKDDKEENTRKAR